VACSVGEVEGANPGDLLGQVAQYGLKYPQYHGALYTLDIGGNDIDKALDEFRANKITINTVGTVVAQAESNTVHAVETLFGLGARNLLFYEVPDLGLTPHFRAEGSAWQNLASGLAASFDQTVLSDLVPLERQHQAATGRLSGHSLQSRAQCRKDWLSARLRALLSSSDAVRMTRA
jgi:phospholipase/lecithinase/hemolysin